MLRATCTLPGLPRKMPCEGKGRISNHCEMRHTRLISYWVRAVVVLASLV